MLHVWLILGIVLGSILSGIIFCVAAVSGTLNIDHSDPEKDVYRLDIGDLDKITKHKYIIIKIDDDANLSQ